jgi:tRNA uracil 4-sulfurtransferase
MNYILHPDEIFLKGSNQPFFYRALKNNLEKLFAGSQVSRVESGMVMRADLNDADMRRLALIPGIANFAPAIISRAENMDALKESTNELIGQDSNFKFFRVTCERSYKKYPFSSQQIEKEIGEHVRIRTNWKVDLKNFDLNIHISVGKDKAVVYGNLIDGAGGLPTDTSGEVLCLMSGGIDSPVAAYKMMCRGAHVGLVHFQNQTKVSAEVGQKIMDLAKTLARYQPDIELFIVPFAGLQKEIVMKVPSTHRMIVSRRLFNKIGTAIASQHGYQALAAGDSLGQVASQTLENMDVIYKDDGMLKLAPLVGMNKKDITSVARTIGTFEISSRPYEDCCSLFLARHPATKARLEDVVRFEKNIDLDALDKKEIISYHISYN